MKKETEIRPWKEVTDKPKTGRYELELAIGGEKSQTIAVLAITALATSELPFRAQGKYLDSLIKKGHIVAAVRCGERGICQIRVHPRAKIEEMKRWSFKMNRYREHLLTEESIPQSDQKRDQFLGSGQNAAGQRPYLDIKGKFKRQSFSATVRFVPSEEKLPI